MVDTKLTPKEIDLIITGLKDLIITEYAIDYEQTGIQCTTPSQEHKDRNKAVKALIKKLKPPVPREKKPELAWRDKKRTDKQTQVLTAFGEKVRGLTRGEASDKITELMKKYKTDNLQVAYGKYLQYDSPGGHFGPDYDDEDYDFNYYDDYDPPW